MRSTTVLCSLLITCVSRAAVFHIDSGGEVGPLFARQYTLTVSGLAGPLSDLDFRFSATSSSISGMSIELFSPNFTRSAVWDAPLGSGAHFQDTYLDDEAGGERLGQPGSNTAPFASSEWGGRSYRPPTNLSVFDGINPNGVWVLLVYQFSGPEVVADVHRVGGSAAWGSALGTQLIINTVPEPSGLLLVGAFGSTLMVLRRGRTKAS